MEYVKFIPPEGVRVPFERSRRAIPPEGAVVPWNTFYRRRHIEVGGTIEPVSAEPIAEPEPPAKSRRSRRSPESEKE